MHKHANVLLARGKRTRTGTQFAPFHIFLFQKISAILVPRRPSSEISREEKEGEDIFWSIAHGQNSKADKIFCSRNIQLFSDLVISSYINHDR